MTIDLHDTTNFEAEHRGTVVDGRYVIIQPDHMYELWREGDEMPHGKDVRPTRAKRWLYTGTTKVKPAEPEKKHYRVPPFASRQEIADVACEIIQDAADFWKQIVQRGVDDPESWIAREFVSRANEHGMSTVLSPPQR